MNRSGEPNKAALNIAAIYILAGAAWITFSDKLVEFLAEAKETVTFISIIKGWVFVAVSGILIFCLVKNAFKRIRTSDENLLNSNRELQKAKDEIAAAYDQLSGSEALLRKQYGDSMASQRQLLELKKKLHDMAYIDQVTNVPNLVSFRDKMQEVINGGEKCALMFVDLDNFKYINDSFGNIFGNRLLKRICDVLSGLMRDNCSIYRIGGDKFGILVENFNNICDIERIAVSLLKGIKSPLQFDNKILYFTASIGIALLPDHGATPDDLLKCSEIAVYKAKEMGKNRIVIFSEQMQIAVLERLEIDRYLRTALENSEFELYYQPVYNMASRTISGFEALIRWRNDDMGFVMPNKFLKVAEDTHMIIDIGEWVLRSACVFQRRLQQEGFEDITISVNVSRLQLLQEDFVDVVLEILDMAGVDAEKLELEIAETIFMESYDSIIGKIAALSKRGVRIAMDNFGKGYSSISRLRQLPISTIKIDKTFADILSVSDESRRLTDLLVSIGKSMDLTIVAEGIETKEQYDYLSGMNCNKAQGYLFSRPIPEREVIGRLQAAKEQQTQ